MSITLYLVRRVVRLPSLSREMATVSCLLCTNVCDDTLDTSINAYYVSMECTPSTDIVCTKCTVCPARYYANQTCGVSFDNDRSDTTCALCPPNTYCTGNGTVPVTCPSFFRSPAHQNVTLQPPYTTLSPTAHACELCADELHKETTSNTQRSPCTVCLPDPDGVYELQACRRDYDARCAACDPCTNGSIYTSQDCSILLDAVCSPCTVCTYPTQYLDIVCTPQNDALCRHISFNRSCQIGQYAGGHTNRADSQCMTCQYRDKQYFGQRLHAAHTSS